MDDNLSVEAGEPIRGSLSAVWVDAAAIVGFQVGLKGRS